MNKITNDKVNIAGLFFDNLTLSEACDKVENYISEYSEDKKASLLLVANQDIYNHIDNYKNLSLDLLNTAFLTIPDGYSIIYGAKYLKRPLKERVTGPDLMLEIIKRSNSKGYCHFFLGAKEGVAEKMSKLFLEQYQDLKIGGCYSPPFGEFTEAENDKIISMVNKAKPDILWVSFGCPKQEWWILNNKAHLNVPIAAGVGAAFDFHSNNIHRAPIILQKLRLEWFYRLLKEPGRLWKRYLNGGINYYKILKKYKK